MPCVAALFQGRDHCAKGRARGIGIGGVVENVGVVCVKSLGHRIDVIAAFGHRQRHDADRGIGHLRDQRGVALIDRDKVDHRAYDFGGAALRVESSISVVRQSCASNARASQSSGAAHPRR